MAAKDAPAHVDDIARRLGLGAEFFHDCAIIAARHEADVLAVGLACDPEPEMLREQAHRRLVEAAEREAEAGELGAGCREQEIALVPGRVGRAVHFGARFAVESLDIMAGEEGIRAQIVGDGEQVTEFHGLVAADARDGRAAGQIAVGKGLHDLGVEGRHIVEHIMGKAGPVGDGAGVGDVGSGAAGPFARRGGVAVGQAQGDPDCLAAMPVCERCDDTGINPARHGHDDPAAGGGQLCRDVTKCCRNSVFAGRCGPDRCFGNNALHHFVHVSGYLQSSLVSRRRQVCRCLGKGRHRPAISG